MRASIATSALRALRDQPDTLDKDRPLWEEGETSRARWPSPCGHTRGEVPTAAAELPAAAPKYAAVTIAARFEGAPVTNKNETWSSLRSARQ